MSDKFIFNEKNVYNDKRSVHVHLPKENQNQRKLNPNEWFKLIFGLVCLLVFVSLTFVLTQQREMPSFSSFIDMLRHVPSIDVDAFVVTDDILGWLKPLVVGDLPEWLSFLAPSLYWINGIIAGIKTFLTWLLMPLDVVAWVGSCLVQLLLYVGYFLYFLGLGIA